MEYFRLMCTIYLKNDIDFKESFDKLAKYISFSMSQDKQLKTTHQSKGFKHYTFGGLFPIEKERVYKKDSSYTFAIHSVNENLINILSHELRKNINNPDILVVETTKKRVKQFFISELYTVTPVIVSIENGLYWTTDKDGDIVKLQKQLHDNLEKKYQDFYGEKIKAKQNFIQLLEIKNRVPQSIYITKNDTKVESKEIRIRFFGNKFKIVPHEDDVSQKLAFLALGSGLGEKNSFGGGFCISRGVEL